MPGNSFGQLFRFTTWGESHGAAIGCVVDGVPPKIALEEADIQHWLDRRRPGASKFTSQRKEPDAVRILSGVFEGLTTGTPIALVIDNVDQRSRDYSEIQDRFRPGHADYAYQAKYGIRDYRGGGRASARETAMRVAAGAIARKVLAAALGKRFQIRGAMVRVGTHEIDRKRWKWKAIEENPFWCPDPTAAKEWESVIEAARKAGSSLGALVEVIATGVPAGLGEPVYDKLDADLAKALMSINAVKGVEIGDGFAAVSQRGSQHRDEMSMDGFASNHAGGILGGISSGQPVTASIVLKPTSSILIPGHSVNLAGEPAEVVTKGRHDPCVGIRATPIAEAMMALVLIDQALRHRAQCGDVGVVTPRIP